MTEFRSTHLTPAKNCHLAKKNGIVNAIQFCINNLNVNEVLFVCFGFRI